MGVDSAEPDWLRTARERGLIVAEGLPAAVGMTHQREVGTPPPPRKPPRKGYDVSQHTSPPPAAWAIEFTIDYSPRNESNIGGGLRAKLGRKAEAKRLTDAAIPPVLGLMPLPVLVTLTRIGGTKRMDDDGLKTAMKFVRDRIAAALGVDDGDTEKVRFRVKQRSGYGKARVMVRVEATSRL